MRAPAVLQRKYIEDHNNDKPQHRAAAGVVHLQALPLLIGMFRGFVGLGRRYVQPDVHALQDFEVFCVLGVG